MMAPAEVETKTLPAGFNDRFEVKMTCLSGFGVCFGQSVVVEARSEEEAAAKAVQWQMQNPGRIPTEKGDALTRVICALPTSIQRVNVLVNPAGITGVRLT